VLVKQTRDELGILMSYLYELFTIHYSLLAWKPELFTIHYSLSAWNYELFTIHCSSLYTSMNDSPFTIQV
jgi:hypothetical protein